MEARLYESTSDVLELLARLNQQVVPWWYLYRNTVPSVASPNVKAWVAGAPMNGEEVEVGMETSENGILLAIFG